MVSYRISDSHVHIGAEERIEDLLVFVQALDLSLIGLLSLPTAGVGEEGDETVNFNPEVLAAAASIRRERSGCRVVAYGSLDNRALLCREGLDPETWDPTAQLREMAAAGFDGLKLWEGKPDLQAALGITLDDERLLSCYRVAGSLGMPVLVHVADPPLFWDAIDTPWSYRGRKVPAFEELLRQAAAIAAAAPQTTFIFPHLLFLAQDLPRLDAFLAEAQNAVLDLAPGNYFYPELGGVPVSRTACDEDAVTDATEASRAFFITWQDRILMGSDGFFFDRGSEILPGSTLEDNLERHLRLSRFLTTDDRFGSPYAHTPGRPMIAGLSLPPEVAKAVLAENAHRLLGDTAVVSATGRGTTSDAMIAYLERWASGPGERGEARDRRVAAVCRRIHKVPR